MEIGGIDSKDRLPDANEKAALQKVMESFCGDFKEIEKRLIQRGVVLRTRLSMAPPEEAYAQIINYTDYELTDKFMLSHTANKGAAAADSQRTIKDE